MESKPENARNRAKIVSLALFTLFLLCLIIVVFEIYLRSSETYIVMQSPHSLPDRIKTTPELFLEYTPEGRRLKPNAHVIIKNHRLSKRDIEINVNSLGFRDEEVPANKGDEEIRIVALGDSITFGAYLPAEDVWVERVETNLSAAYPDKRISVINTGVGDIGLKEEVDILEERGLSVEPDLVLVAMYLNDNQPPWNVPARLGHRGFFRSHLLLVEYIYRGIAFRSLDENRKQPLLRFGAKAARLDWKNDRKDFLTLASDACFDWGAAWDEDWRNTMRKQMARLRRITHKKDLPVAVVMFPVSFQVYAEFVENGPQEHVRSLAEELGFHYLDILPALRKHRDKSLFFDHCHPNTEGNIIVGEAISEFLADSVLTAVIESRSGQVNGDR